jgi:hypothetical protein
MQITPRGLDRLVSQGLLSPGAKQGWQKALMRVFKITPITQPKRNKRNLTVTSHTETRRSARMYAHDSSRALRAEQRGETKKPRDVVALARVRHRDELSALNDRHRNERAKLDAALEREKLTNSPRRGGAESGCVRKKKMAEAHRHERETMFSRHHHEIERLSEMHPVL